MALAVDAGVFGALYPNLSLLITWQQGTSDFLEIYPFFRSAPISGTLPSSQHLHNAYKHSSTV